MSELRHRCMLKPFGACGNLSSYTKVKIVLHITCIINHRDNINHWNENMKEGELPPPLLMPSGTSWSLPCSLPSSCSACAWLENVKDVGNVHFALWL